MQYTTHSSSNFASVLLFYQDFKDTFVCNTQLLSRSGLRNTCCFIRISKILLYAIHNYYLGADCVTLVVLSGFQRYFCMQYTTCYKGCIEIYWLFYQDFKDTFVCNTQRNCNNAYLANSCFIRISKILLYAIHNY